MCNFRLVWNWMICQQIPVFWQVDWMTVRRGVLVFYGERERESKTRINKKRVFRKRSLPHASMRVETNLVGFDDSLIAFENAFRGFGKFFPPLRTAPHSDKVLFAISTIFLARTMTDWKDFGTHLLRCLDSWFYFPQDFNAFKKALLVYASAQNELTQATATDRAELAAKVRVLVCCGLGRIVAMHSLQCQCVVVCVLTTAEIRQTKPKNVADQTV